MYQLMETGRGGDVGVVVQLYVTESGASFLSVHNNQHKWEGRIMLIIGDDIPFYSLLFSSILFAPRAYHVPCPRVSPRGARLPRTRRKSATSCPGAC
jgi:hypothetical protein